MLWLKASICGCVHRGTALWIVEEYWEWCWQANGFTIASCLEDNCTNTALGALLGSSCDWPQSPGAEMYELSCMHNVCVLWLAYSLKSKRVPSWQHTNAAHIINSEKQVRVMNIKVELHTSVSVSVVYRQTQKQVLCSGYSNRYSCHVVETKLVVSLNFLKPYWTCNLHFTVLTFSWWSCPELLTKND